MSFGFQKTTNNASKTIDSSNITINGSDLTSTINQILQDNVTDSSNFAGCATIAGDNSFTGSNTMNALTIPSSMAVSSSAISLSKLPRLASSITPSNANDLATKQYTDDAGGTVRTNLLGADNTFTGVNTFINANYTNAFRVGSALTFSPSNLVFNKIPMTDSDRTSEITDDKNFTTKKYVDNLKSSNNAWTGTNTFSNVPSTTTDLTANMTNDNNFITRGYLKNNPSVISVKSNTYVCGGQVYYKSLSPTSYVLYPPVPSTSAYTFYINFPTSINTGSDTFFPMANSCNVSLNYHYQQANLINSFSGFTDNQNGTYSTTSMPLSADIKNCNTAQTTFWIHNNFCKFMVSTLRDDVNVVQLQAITTVWEVSNPVGAITRYGKPKVLAPMTTYDSANFTSASETVSPIDFTKVTPQKVRVEIRFPVLNSSNSSMRNNPTKLGWVPAFGATFSIDNSMPFTDTSLGNLNLSPSVNMNTPTGGAWLSLN